MTTRKMDTFYTYAIGDDVVTLTAEFVANMVFIRHSRADYGILKIKCVLDNSMACLYINNDAKTYEIFGNIALFSLLPPRIVMRINGWLDTFEESQ